MTRPPYELRFRPAALRQLRKLDGQMARRIKSATDVLCTEPRPQGAKALSGQHGWLRIRVGDYRIVYEVRDSELVVLVIQVATAATCTTASHGAKSAVRAQDRRR